MKLSHGKWGDRNGAHLEAISSTVALVHFLMVFVLFEISVVYFLALKSCGYNSRAATNLILQCVT